MAGVNYPQLGSVNQVTRFYKEGETWRHPSGVLFKRVNGNWTRVEEPKS